MGEAIAAALTSPATTSIHAVRRGKREGLDLRVERGAILALHGVVAMHGADRRSQRAETGVLERLSRLEPGLLSHHSRTFHRFDPSIAVGDDPLAAEQRCDLTT